ncbi:MAG: septum formation initiator family protein [Verrucomicrobiota bacterium]
MSGKRMDVAGLVRLESRIRVIQGVRRMVFIVFCASAGFLVVATAFPQKREMERLEAKLEAARENERRVVTEQEHRHIELRALREDPAYLEIQARDRLDYCQDGERVLRFRRDR